jgi:hypothetical protein
MRPLQLRYFKILISNKLQHIYRCSLLLMLLLAWACQRTSEPKGQHIPEHKNTTHQTTSENHEHLHFVEYHLAGIKPEGKTWLPDMDGCYFTAPVYLAGVDNGWPDAYGNSCHGPDCWMWETKFAEHPWLADKNYKGSMTFFPGETISFLIENNQHNENATGLVHIDTLDMKIRTAGAAILHPSNWDHLVSNWDSVRILSITDDYLQLAVLRDLFTEEKNNLLVFNYVSENYYRSWLAAKQSKQTIRIDAQTNYNFAQITQALAGTTGSSKTWVIDQDWPINWFNEMGQASASAKTPKSGIGHGTNNVFPIPEPPALPSRTETGNCTIPYRSSTASAIQW